MLIILVRHAEREYRRDREEALQILTAKGQQAATHLGEALAARLKTEGRTVSSLLTSPYTRAFQTASLVAPHLNLSPAQIHILDTLRPAPEGSVSASLEPVLAAAPDGVVVAGHGPDLADLSRQLCGLPVELKKAQAVAIEWQAEANQGRLLWQVGHK